MNRFLLIWGLGLVLLIGLRGPAIEHKFHVQHPFDDREEFRFLGFELRNYTPYVYTHEAIFRVPLWPAFALIALAAAIFVRRQVRQTSDLPQCRNCSYNLTGNVSGICPECGERFDANQNEAAG